MRDQAANLPYSVLFLGLHCWTMKGRGFGAVMVAVLSLLEVKARPFLSSMGQCLFLRPFSEGSSEAVSTNWVISCHLQTARRAFVSVGGRSAFPKGRRSPALSAHLEVALVSLEVILLFYILPSWRLQPEIADNAHLILYPGLRVMGFFMRPLIKNSDLIVTCFRCKTLQKKTM